MTEKSEQIRICHEAICEEYRILVDSGMSKQDAIRFLQRYGESNEQKKLTRSRIYQILIENNLYKPTKK